MQWFCIFRSELNILPKEHRGAHLCLLSESCSGSAFDRWAKNYARSPSSFFPIRGKTFVTRKQSRLVLPKRGKMGSGVVLCVRNPDKWSVRPENKLHGDRMGPSESSYSVLEEQELNETAQRVQYRSTKL